MKKAFHFQLIKTALLLFFLLMQGYSLIAQIDCSRGHFYTWGMDGFIYPLVRSGNTITLGNAIGTTAATTSRFGLAIADLGNGNAFYSSGSTGTALDYDILKYSNNTWQTLLPNPYPNSLHNAGGKGNYLYYQYIGSSNQTGVFKHSKLFRFDGTTLTTIFSDTTIFMQIADIAVDNTGNIYFFTGSTPYPNTDVTNLRVLSPSGNLLANYPIAFDGENANGSFLEDSILYVGIGPSNATYANKLLPIIISNGTATLGTPLAMPHPIIGGTIGNPTYLNFSDLASCTSSSIQLPLKVVDQTIENSVELFPNPTSDKLIVQCQHNGNAFVKVFDITGKPLLIQSFTSFKTCIDLSSFESGVYQVVIQHDDSIISIKVIKY